MEKANLIGQRFGNLVCTKWCKRINGRHYWYCECDCHGESGFPGYKITTTNQLRSGRSNSCGCMTKAKKSLAATKHGKRNTRLYTIWTHMRYRCNDPKEINYCNYGAKGIRVCSEWDNLDNGFENFYNWAMENGYSDTLTLDREDPYGNYEPTNCRWVNYFVQENNRTNNHLLEINGEVDTLSNWARKYGKTPDSVKDRLKLGWTPIDALSIPIGSVHRYKRRVNSSPFSLEKKE